MSLKRHLDTVIMQHAYWQPHGFIWIHRLKHHRTGGKFIQIGMTTTPTPLRLSVHFSCPILPTGGISMKHHTQSMPISSLWHTTYFLSYYMGSEWRPVLPLGKTFTDRGSRKPQARPFGNQSLLSSMEVAITGDWQELIWCWIRPKLKTTYNWRENHRKRNCTK